MLHDSSFITGFLLGQKQGGGGGTDLEMIKRAAAQSNRCDIWQIPKYDTVTDISGNSLALAVQRTRRLTYVTDVLRVAYNIYLHVHTGASLAWGDGSKLSRHTTCLTDSSVEPADYGAHPMDWTSARSILVVSDSLIAVIAEHPELKTPIVMTGFVRVLAASSGDKDGWRPISESALPNYLTIYQDNAFAATQPMELIDDLTDMVLDNNQEEEFLYENGSAGYLRGIRCVRSLDGQGQYVVTDRESNHNFIGSFDATGTCTARNDGANTSQMYLCGWVREVTDPYTQMAQKVVDRWWLTITGTGPDQRGLLPRESCTYDYTTAEIDEE